jgi:uncharacterized protein (DUF697 family)
MLVRPIWERRGFHRANRMLVSSTVRLRPRKLVPVLGTVAAGTLNAAAGFAITVAIGEAACVWLAYQRHGQVAPTDAVRRAFAEGLAAGRRQAKSLSASQSVQPGPRA